MTLALDHSPAVITPRPARLVRGIRARIAEFHRYWFVDCLEPSDALAQLTSREQWDLPTWHPAEPED